ncbi:MAG: hypothetical protein AB1453_00045 [Chloroflexota bacterium]
MKRNFAWITTELLLYLLVCLAALLFRLLQLGALPLGDNEARLGLQALALADGLHTVSLDAEVGYLVGTSGLFYLFAATNFLARLIPALLGAGFCFLPYLTRDWLGKKPALILALALALDPGGIMASRLAGGMTWTLFFIALFILALFRNHPRLAGAAAGLALLGGASLWKFILPLGLALLLFARFFKSAEAALWLPWKRSGFAWKQMFAWGIGSMLVFGSMLLLVPQGLGAAADSIIAYLNGWSAESIHSAGSLILALLVYQPFGWIFAVAQLIRQVKTPSALDRFLGIWWLIAIFLALIYPARQPLDILWSSIPMLVLSARMLAEILRFDFERKQAALVYGAVVMVLWFFAAQNLTRLINNLQISASIQTPLIGLIAAFFFILASVVLIGWGWSVRTASMGMAWGTIAILGIFTIAAAWHTTGMGSRPDTRLLASDPLLLEADLLKGTVGDLSEWNTGLRNQMELMIVDLDKPSMRWLFRDYPQVVFERVIPPQAEPALVITPVNISPASALAYRGQDFSWSSMPRWDLMIGLEWVEWLVLRSAPMDQSMVILWAQENLFPGSEAQPTR